ncbi:hypothetical protein [Marinomonas sp. IMCC 4694]|uniref:hypothetical protein n=1 Tax=Marinomonas sp. IMCC 4694 TaxID=2605432 RepID=UPI0011E61806|nr:hypothetical protein [Marinomonas sp. IMCC 4694]TYL48881.1 hypothetical protein FXV75_13685 [Marinomonas sp. IMCC 4694]
MHNIVLPMKLSVWAKKVFVTERHGISVTMVLFLCLRGSYLLGPLGVDLNADHLAIVETDLHGNPVNRSRIDRVTYGKTKEQRKAVIGMGSKSPSFFRLKQISRLSQKNWILKERKRS